MKTVKRLLSVAVCMAVLLSVWVLPGAVGVRAEEPLKVLAIGNSYACNTCRYVSRIAESMGFAIEADTLYYGGCSIQQHVKFYETDDPQYWLYVNDKTDWQYLTMKEALTRQQYDIITFQQSPTDARDFKTYQTDENPYLEKLLAYVRALQPDATFMVNQTWAACANVLHGEGQYTQIYYSDGRLMYEEIEAAYRQMSDFMGGATILPCGTAVQLAVDEFGYSADHTDPMTVYNDDISHMNGKGEYLTGCVWAEILCGKDCRTATFNDYIADYKVLQEIAHEAASGEQPTVVDGLRVVDNADGVTLLRYKKDAPADGVLTLPTMVGGKKLTAIHAQAFKNVEGIKEISVPESVRKIEKGALNGMKVTYIKPNYDEGKTDPSVPVWVWPAIGGGVVLLAGAVLTAVLLKRKKKRKKNA